MCLIYPNHKLFCGVFLTTIYDITHPPALKRFSVNARDSHLTEFVIDPLKNKFLERKILLQMLEICLEGDLGIEFPILLQEKP